MACFYPINGYHQIGGGLTFKKSSSNASTLTVPCGQCLGCRMARSKEWAIRIMHEAQMHDDNCFLTLTYEDAPHSVNLKHFQNFMKRLRKQNEPKKIRLFHCGEYGQVYTIPGDPTSEPVEHPLLPEKNAIGRAHYHAILFGHDFMDKIVHKYNHLKQPLYTSETLTKLWGHGFASVGTVTEQSAAYTARYIFKKVTGDLSDTYYSKVDEQGEIHSIKPEYVTMSRGNNYPRGHPLKTGGIGHSWLEKYGEDIFSYDECVINGKKRQFPDITSITSKKNSLIVGWTSTINGSHTSNKATKTIPLNAWQLKHAVLQRNLNT
ncbi:MAG: replication initiator protein [Microviridae sp.]|nr:MAG: replication initiator protein [Microviridae sp.]